MHGWRWVALLGVLLGTVACAGEGASTGNSTPVARSTVVVDQQAGARVVPEIEALVQRFVARGDFSGAILVAQDGHVLMSAGYGLAHIEHEVPNTPTTKFLIGSLTKQFTALAIMQLHEQGRLQVDDPLVRYFPDYPMGDQITLHHLLTHSSGIPNFTNFSDYSQSMLLPAPIETTIAKFKSRPLDFPPGAGVSYSNSGYILLGTVIQQVSGQSYEAYLRQHIFEPAGMYDSGYAHQRPLLKGRAAGYDEVGGALVNASYIDMSVPFAAGALYATVEDLYRWDQSIQGDRLLSQPGWERIFTPFAEKFGYGWEITSEADRRLIRHGGNINGFAAEIARYPDQKVTIIVLSNFAHAPVESLRREIANLLFARQGE